MFVLQYNCCNRLNKPYTLLYKYYIMNLRKNQIFNSMMYQSLHLRTRRDRIIWVKERQNPLTVDHLKWLIHHSIKKARLVWVGSRTHLRIKRACDVFVSLKLQTMAWVLRLERRVMLLESIGLPLTDTHIWGKWRGTISQPSEPQSAALPIELHSP